MPIAFEKVPTCPTKTTPATPAIAPPAINDPITIRSVRTPESRAASRLNPEA